MVVVALMYLIGVLYVVFLIGDAVGYRAGANEAGVSYNLCDVCGESTEPDEPFEIEHDPDDGTQIILVTPSPYLH